jgi:acetylornithine deacetylase
MKFSKKISKKEQKVLETIDSERSTIVEFLQNMIRIPSVGCEVGEEKKAQDFVSTSLRKEKFKVDMWEPDWEELKKHPAYNPVKLGYKNRPNVVGTLKGVGKGRSLILNGHIDVVGPGPGWSVDPWGGEISNGKIYGRGSADMKSGIAAMIMAAKCIQEAEVKLKGDLIVESVVDEEIGGNGTLACVMRGYKADVAIVGETSNLEIALATPGGYGLRIRVLGRSVGPSRKFEGVSPIEKAWKIYNTLPEIERIRQATKKHPLIPPEAIIYYVYQFTAGTEQFLLPEEATIGLFFRFMPYEGSENFRKEFEDYIRKISDLDSWMRDHPPIIERKGYVGEGSDVPVNHPIAKILENSFTECIGKKPKISCRHAACDAGILQRHGNTPSVVFGPGLTAQMHKIDEFVQVEDYINATKVIALTILRWCGTTE